MAASGGGGGGGAPPLKKWLNMSVNYALWLLLSAKTLCCGGSGPDGDERPSIWSRCGRRLCRGGGRGDENWTLVRTLLRQNRLATATYCCLYCGFGMCVGVVGPVLLDLTCLYASTMSAISWAFFAHTLCTVVGSILVGAVSKWVASDFLLLLAALQLPLSLAMLALSRDLGLAVVSLSLVGLSNGVVDCLANFQMVYLYEKAVSPFLHAMYFSYGVGALISPLVAQPFLLNKDCSPYVENGTALPAAWQERIELHRAFWIMTGLQVPNAILMLVLVAYGGFRVRAVSPRFQRLVNSESSYSLSKTNGHAPPADVPGNATTGGGSGGSRVLQKYVNAARELTGARLWKNLVVTVCVVSIAFLYDGMQGNYSQFVSSYALKEVRGYNESDGAYVNSAFWGSFTAGRLVAVALSVCFTPYMMLIVSIVGSTVSLALLVCMPMMKATLIFGTSLFGLFCSSVTPAAISMAEQFVNMNRLHMTLVVVAASAGELLIPIIQSQIFEKNTRSFLVMAVTCAAVSCFLYLAFWLVGKSTAKFRSMKHDSFAFVSIVPLPADQTLAADDAGVPHDDPEDRLDLRQQQEPCLDAPPSPRLQQSQMVGGCLDDDDEARETVASSSDCSDEEAEPQAVVV